MKVLCINLDSRPDRWAESQTEFAKVGLSVDRLPASTGNNRVRAFNHSVYRAMKEAEYGKEVHNWKAVGGEIKTGYEPDDLLLFEDDVCFDGFNEGHMNILAMVDDLLGNDWLTLHLGANIIGMHTTEWQMPEKFKPGIAKLHNCWQSHATLYSAKCVQFIVDDFLYWKEEYEVEGCQIFDEWLRVNVLSQGKSYVLSPMVAYQRPDTSDIWGGPQDYTSCHKRGNEYLKTLV